jgi:FKBP-type peptidyl-prolyl cis-trans isomerase
VRKIIALGVSAGLLISLAACSTSEPSGECTPTATAGAASKLVSATGAIGSAPTAEFATPVVAKDLQVSVLTKGDGPIVYNGDEVEFFATGFSATTGALASPANSYETPLTSQVSDKNILEQLFQCTTVGSRLAVVLPPDKTVGTTGTSVYIIDIAGSYYGKAAGTIDMPEAGFPSVVTAPNGQPGVTILSTPAPTELRYSTLVTGRGEKVKAGDKVKLKYSAFDWTTKTQVSSTWTDDGPAVSKALTAYSTDVPIGLAAGALKALIGKTVGSQVIVILPPKSYANGIDFSASSGSTLVIVYDILAVTN